MIPGEKIKTRVLLARVYGKGRKNLKIPKECGHEFTVSVFIKLENLGCATVLLYYVKSFTVCKHVQSFKIVIGFLIKNVKKFSDLSRILSILRKFRILIGTFEDNFSKNALFCENFFRFTKNF